MIMALKTAGELDLGQRATIFNEAGDCVRSEKDDSFGIANLECEFLMRLA